MLTAAPPRPPALDAGRAALARDTCAAALAAASAALQVGDPADGYAAGGCRIVAAILADLARGYASRSNDRIDRHADELARFVAILPARLKACRTLGAWAEGRPIELGLGLPKRFGGKRRGG